MSEPAGPLAADDPDRWLSLPREAWLALHGELFDPETIERLERIEVAAGSQVLEVGAGSGSIAVWLARRVGPSGRVVATDVDTRFLERISQPQLEVLRHDVTKEEFAGQSFDLIHCRAVLAHLPDRDLVIEGMVGWLRPGGILLAEEPWIDVGRLAPDPVVARATAHVETAHPHIDGGFARRMPTLMRAAGLEGVEAEGRLAFFDGGSKRATYYSTLLEKYCSSLVERGELGPADVEKTLARFADPEWCDCGWPRIAAWGRKPAGRPGWRQRLAAARSRATARLRRDG
jgi:SAM-dependent methyltransferase